MGAEIRWSSANRSVTIHQRADDPNVMYGNVVDGTVTRRLTAPGHHRSARGLLAECSHLLAQLACPANPALGAPRREGR